MVDTKSGSNEKILAFLGELSEFYELPVAQPSQLLGIFTRGIKEQHGRGFQQRTHRSWHKCTGEDDARSVCHFCGVYCQADLAQLIILPIV